MIWTTWNLRPHGNYFRICRRSFSALRRQATGSRQFIAAIGIFAMTLFSNGNRTESAESSTDEIAAAEIQDLLFCATRRPFLIRLRLSVKGTGFRALRQQWADAQFTMFDTDKNGYLEGDELKHLPVSQALQAGLAVGFAKSLQADSDPEDGKVSRTECRRYLIESSSTPFTLLSQNNASGVVFSNDITNAQVNLFPKLDANQDGKLSREEIAVAATKLRRYDRNEDDAVDALELQQGIPGEQAAARQKMSGVLGLVIVVDRSEEGLTTSRRLLELYDKAARFPASKTFRKDECLSNSELPIDDDDFRRADHNKDGKLDRSELAVMSSAMTPSVELAIEAPSVAGQFVVRSLRPCDKAHSEQIDLKQETDGRWTLVLNETAFSLSAAGPLPGVEQELRTTYLQQFKNLDQDRNDYLDRNEFLRVGFQDTFFKQADTDDDGKLFEKEYQAQVEREIELSKTTFVLDVAGDGRSLFRLIDANPADGRLTLRELAEASERLSQWDANGDGAITQTELSIALNAVFRVGTPRVNGPFVIGQGNQINSNQGENAAAAATSHPSWFVKMDRNGDGDLSPKEFLGRRALFDKIDLNRDGLISADEAIAAHREAAATARP